MIRFFPMPYPNESIYNIFVRYDKKTGNNNYYLTAEDLMGNIQRLLFLFAIIWNTYVMNFLKVLYMFQNTL